MIGLLFTLPVNEKKKYIDIDEDLILRIANNDNDAFCKLYSLIDKAIYGFILSIVKNQFDAEDIMQNTFIKIRTSAHLYKKQGKPLAWIFTIARNITLMEFRSKNKLSSNSFDELSNDIKFSDEINVDDKIVLEAVFKVLTAEERQIVIMHALTGMKHREIAEILELPTSTVLSKYSRSIKKMQNSFMEKGVN